MHNQVEKFAARLGSVSYKCSSFNALSRVREYVQVANISKKVSIGSSKEKEKMEKSTAEAPTAKGTEGKHLVPESLTKEKQIKSPTEKSSMSPLKREDLPANTNTAYNDRAMRVAQVLAPSQVLVTPPQALVTPAQSATIQGEGVFMVAKSVSKSFSSRSGAFSSGASIPATFTGDDEDDYFHGFVILSSDSLIMRS